jgi:uncharacterized protein YcfJ
MMKKLLALAMLAAAAAACGESTAAMTPDELQREYGVTNAYNGTFQTPEGALKGTVIPVKLADGREAQLFIPAQRRDADSLYIRDEEGFHPVLVDQQLKREDYVRSEQVVTRRAESSATREVPRKKRSWEKEALIIGGSAGGGALVGGLAGGKKGAAVGAAAGGIGGLIYDLATRKK